MPHSIDAPVAELSKNGSRKREANKTLHFAAESDSERDELVSQLSARLGMQTSRILVTGMCAVLCCAVYTACLR